MTTNGVVSQIDGEIAIIEFTVAGSTFSRKVQVSKGSLAEGQAVMVDASLL